MAGQRSACGPIPPTASTARLKRYNELLRDLIIAGQATPSLIVSHELPLTAAPEAYDKFDRRIDGYTKVLLHP